MKIFSSSKPENKINLEAFPNKKKLRGIDYLLKIYKKTGFSFLGIIAAGSVLGTKFLIKPSTVFVSHGLSGLGFFVDSMNFCAPFSSSKTHFPPTKLEIA
jgi:hypothetical protein